MAERHKSNGHVLPNGKGKANQVVEKLEEEDVYQEENIFLFIPNIIGELFCIHFESAQDLGNERET